MNLLNCHLNVLKERPAKIPKPNLNDMFWATAALLKTTSSIIRKYPVVSEGLKLLQKSLN